MNKVVNPYEELLKQDKDRERKICFYGRVSTEHEAQLDALDAQMQWYDELLKSHKNWTLYKKYIDRGITGTQANKRPAFLEMIEDARNGNFDLIVTREVSRFARNTVDTLSFTRLLKQKYNIEVYFVMDNIWTFDGDGELRLTIMATLAQDESRKISERVKAGQKISRDNGVLYGTGNILGYDRVNGKYVINEVQAATVKKIFNLYLSGMTMNQIRDKLTIDGDKTAEDGKWSTTSISRILNKITYCGVMAYGQSYSSSYLEQKRRSNRDKDSYMLKEIETIPKIISKDDFDKVQRIIESRKSEKRDENGKFIFVNRGTKTKKNIWTKKLKCGCGSSVRLNNYHVKSPTPNDMKCYYYECYNRVQFGTPEKRRKLGLPITENECGIKGTPGWKLYMMADAVIKKVIGNKNKVEELVIDIIEDSYSPDNDVDTNALSSYNGLLSKLEGKKARAIEMRADGEISKDEYLTLKRNIDEQISTTRDKISTLTTKKNKSDKEKEIKKVHAAVEQMITKDTNYVDDDVIEEFIYKVVKETDTRYVWFVNFGAYSNNDKDEIIETYMTGISGRKGSDNINIEISPIVTGDLQAIGNSNTGGYCK